MRSQTLSCFLSITIHGIIIAVILSMGTLVTESTKVIRIDFSLLPPRPALPVIEPESPFPPPIERVVQKKPDPVVRSKPNTQKAVPPAPEMAAEIPEPLPSPHAEDVMHEEIAPAETFSSQDTVTQDTVIKEMPIIASERIPFSDSVPAIPVATPVLSPAEQYRQEHFQYIIAHIRKKLSYPVIARKKGWQGTVTVSFIVCEDGGVRDIRIVESSGISLLDKSAIKTVEEARPFPKPPTQAEIIVPIAFTLS